ncbi:hypothetical protein KA977_04205 [Candidatus Dependentiae bacterium]|nr:hypothetical protein [Candidatus Dependentiae bacterium]
MSKTKIYIIILSVIFLSNCTTSRHSLKYSDNFSIQSSPVKIKYKIKPGENIEGKFVISRWFWLFRSPATINIADNIYAIEPDKSSSQSIFDNAGVINTISPVPIIVSLVKPISDWFKNDNLINTAKAAAVYEACEQNNYNIILTPVYECKITSFLFYKRIKVVVKGKGAHISEIIVDDENLSNTNPKQ